MSLSKALIKVVPTKIIRGLQRRAFNNEKTLKTLLKLEKEEDIIALGEKYALKNFKIAAKKVPAYKKFLRENRVDPRKIRSFKDFVEKVPVMTKDNYINKYPLNELCINGNVNVEGVFDRSSGYSGKSIYFPLMQDENIKDEKIVGMWFRFQFDIRPHDLLLNCFFLGSWVAGIKVGNASRQIASIINVGARIEEAVEVIFDLHEYYRRVIVTAYPPFILQLIHKLRKGKFDFSKKPFLFLTGGEGFDEEFRKTVFKLTEGNSEVFSAYGATELGIRVANETKETIQLRKMALENRELAKALFGKEYPPLIFQYDPTNTIITPIKMEGKKVLVCTSGSEKLMPIIKYNIKDEGGIYTQKELNRILKKVVGKEIKFSLPLPIVYVFGRADGTISLSAVPIYPHQIYAGLLPFIDKIKDYKVEVKRNEDLMQYPEVSILTDDKRQLKPKEIEKSLFDHINSLEFPYKEMLSKKLVDMPVVKIYNEKDWPFVKKETIKMTPLKTEKKEDSNNNKKRKKKQP